MAHRHPGCDQVIQNNIPSCQFGMFLEASICFFFIVTFLLDPANVDGDDPGQTGDNGHNRNTGKSTPSHGHHIRVEFQVSFNIEDHRIQILWFHDTVVVVRVHQFRPVWVCRIVSKGMGLVKPHQSHTQPSVPHPAISHAMTHQFFCRGPILASGVFHRSIH